MGITHLPILLILGVVALLVFGPKRLPELGHGLGKAITEFKKGVSELTTSGSQDHMTAASAAPASLVAQPPTTEGHPDPEPAAVGSVAKVG